MQIHYYKTEHGRAWQKYNQKKYGYNPKFAEVRPMKRRKRKEKPLSQKDIDYLNRILGEEE